MKPKDKYTIFDRKEKNYRKGIHSELMSCLVLFGGIFGLPLEYNYMRQRKSSKILRWQRKNISDISFFQICLPISNSSILTQPKAKGTNKQPANLSPQNSQNGHASVRESILRASSSLFALPTYNIFVHCTLSPAYLMYAFYAAITTPIGKYLNLEIKNQLDTKFAKSGIQTAFCDGIQGVLGGAIMLNLASY